MSTHHREHEKNGQTVPSCIRQLTARRKLWFESNGEFVIGEGGFELLNAIAATGSLTGAARVVGWSYRHAWGYVRRSERVLGSSLTTRRPGKGARRGVDLTSVARDLMQAARRAGWRPNNTNRI
jgi:molybdate transport system regulatory protein